MLIGARLRQLREQKQMSQGDIEERTGLLRCYVSRVENGHTVPSLETLDALLGFSTSRCISSFSLEKRLHSTPSLTPRQTLKEMMADDGDKGAGCSIPPEAQEPLDPSGRAGSGCPSQSGQEIGHSLGKPLHRPGLPMTRGIQASDLEGGMTVSGPSRSRMTRPLGTDWFSWYW